MCRPREQWRSSSEEIGRKPCRWGSLVCARCADVSVADGRRRSKTTALRRAVSIARTRNGEFRQGFRRRGGNIQSSHLGRLDGRLNASLLHPRQDRRSRMLAGPTPRSNSGTSARCSGVEPGRRAVLRCDGISERFLAGGLAGIYFRIVDSSLKASR